MRQLAGHTGLAGLAGHASHTGYAYFAGRYCRLTKGNWDELGLGAWWSNHHSSQ